MTRCGHGDLADRRDHTSISSDMNAQYEQYVNGDQQGGGGAHFVGACIFLGNPCVFTRGYLRVCVCVCVCVREVRDADKPNTLRH